MVKLDDAVLARINKDGHHFEIWVDPFMAWDYKHGKTEGINFNDMIALDTVYSDAKKGDEASAELVQSTFDTNNFEEIAKVIIVNGEVQLTTTQRNQMLEKRKNEIINFIVENAHDPQASTPVPRQRVENALDEAKYKFSLSRKKDDETKEVLLQLKKVMPISLEKIVVSMEIPSTYAGKVQPILHRYEMVEEKWLPNGSLFTKLKIASGLKSKLMNEFNNITHGEVTIHVEK